MKLQGFFIIFTWGALLSQNLATAKTYSDRSSEARRWSRLEPRSNTVPVPDCRSEEKHAAAAVVNEGLAVRAGASPKLSISKELQTALLGTAVLAGVEQLMKQVLKSLDIKFPAMLAGCLGLFASLLVLDQIQPKLANNIATFLTPGAALLAKWLPVFFVPGLALLPLAHSVGGPMEIAKVLVVVMLGLAYTILTVGATVATLTGKSIKVGAGGGVKALKKAKAKAPPAKPFSEQHLKIFGTATAIAGVATLITSGGNALTRKPIAKFSEACFLTCFTVVSYVWAARLPTDFVKVVHPLVTCCVMILALVKGMSIVLGGRSFHDILRSYKVGSIDLKKAGSGDILLAFLGPSAVSFAISMFGKRALLSKNLLTILAAVMVSSVGGLFGTAAFVRLIKLGGQGLGSRTVRLSMLSRNVTTALALALTNMIGGDLSLAAAVVCLTGVMGATYGKPFLAYFGITDPIMRGLCIGSSAQGLGVASMADESEAFPFAAIAMVLTAVTSTTLVTFPSVKSALVKLATGSKI